MSMDNESQVESMCDGIFLDYLSNIISNIKYLNSNFVVEMERGFAYSSLSVNDHKCLSIEIATEL